jgi:site-specific DNA-methyltransferase (adenine-specific)
MNLDNLVGERHHAPDILDCLANLSSDEVFTPPHIAQKMLDLLPSEVWSNPDLKFLDPVCKTGVFLRECASRLMAGLSVVMPDEDRRREHIFRNMLFGISITELTGHISRRSVYYSKDASSSYSIVTFDDPQGHLKYFRSNHTFINGRCSICGSPEAIERGSALENYAYSFIHEKDIYKMKFDVVIGNPPYQLEDGGFGASASPIYHLFVNKAIGLDARYVSFIIPARWYAGGKGLDEFRDQMINDRSLKYLVDYPKLFECFPGVEIKGGICYFLRDKQWDGDCEVSTIMDGEVVSRATRDIRLGGNVLIRSNEAVAILDKVRHLGEVSFDSVVSRQKPFGMRTFFDDYTEQVEDNKLQLYRRGGISYIDHHHVLKNQAWIPKWKTFTPMAGDGHGRIPMKVTGEPIVGRPNAVCTETYLVAGVWESEREATNCANYLCSKFVRFLISLRKNTQHLTSDRFSFVPLLPMNQRWTDKMLYEKYELTSEEIDHIESTILEMSI